VAQISHLNEKLVMKMWEKKAKKSGTSTKKTVTPPVTRSTAASRAALYQNQSIKQPAFQLRTTNSMQSCIPKKKKVVTKKTNKSQLEEANGGQIPFLLGMHPGPTFSVIGHAQEALRQSDAYNAVAPDTHQHLNQSHAELPTDKLQDDCAKAPKGISVVTDNSNHKVEFMSNMSKAVASVEKEFQELNDRYILYVSYMSKNDVFLM
jgi:hypothetical protein